MCLENLEIILNVDLSGLSWNFSIWTLIWMIKLAYVAIIDSHWCSKQGCGRLWAPHAFAQVCYGLLWHLQGAEEKPAQEVPPREVVVSGHEPRESLQPTASWDTLRHLETVTLSKVNLSIVKSGSCQYLANLILNIFWMFWPGQDPRALGLALAEVYGERTRRGLQHAKDASCYAGKMPMAGFRHLISPHISSNSSALSDSSGRQRMCRIRYSSITVV